MASRGSYKSLPADLDEGSASNTPEEHQQLRTGNGASAISSSSSSRNNDDDTRNNDAAAESPSSSPAGGGKKTAKRTSTTSDAASVRKKSSSPSGGDKSIDPTGGLPTAEGVFVGDPVSQSTAYPTATVSGNYDHHHAASAAHANVITSAPAPTYSNHVATAAAAAMGGAGTGIAIPQGGAGGVGGMGQHTVIVMNAPPGHQFGEWGRQPQPFVCRACGYAGLSAAVTVRERRVSRSWKHMHSVGSTVSQSQQYFYMIVHKLALQQC